MKFRWWFYPLYLLALPNTLVGLLLALYYRPSGWRWSDGCLEAIVPERMIGRPGAQTWGFMIFYRGEQQRQYEALRVHERVHVVQAFFGSVLFMLAYGLHFLWNFARVPSWVRTRFGAAPRWWLAYRAIWFEVQAYDIEDDFLLGRKQYVWGSK